MQNKGGILSILKVTPIGCRGHKNWFFVRDAMDNTKRTL